MADSRRPIWTAVVLLLLGLGACANQEHGAGPSAEAPPSYVAAAARYNERIEKLDQLIAQHVSSIRYVDDEGERRKEDFDGVIQVVRPDSLSMSIKKVSQNVGWFGCNDERYWWLELGDSRRASFGRHEAFERLTSPELSMPLRPLDVIRLLGVTLLPAEGGGTAWSGDGHRLCMTSPIGSGGEQRVHVDRVTFLVQRIEVFDEHGVLVVSAEHSMHMPVEQRRDLGARPQIGGRITIEHPASETVLNMELGGASDGPVSSEAFDFERLCARLGIESFIDLDADDDPSL